MKFILISTVCIGISCYGFEIDEKIISSFTREIYYRYYLIKRCKDPIQILITNKDLWQHIQFDKLSTEYIQNTDIKKSIQSMRASHQIDPFIELWHQMNAHRHVNDPVFQKDFISLLFMLYTSLAVPSQQRNSHDPIYIQATGSQSIEKMLSIIDKNLDNFHLPKTIQRPKTYKNIADQKVSTDDIALTYYLIQRLDKAIQVILATQKTIPSSLFLSHQKATIDKVEFDAEISFSHERINHCFTQILIKKNLEPLLQIWEEFTCFRHAGDSHFLKEMLMMLFTVYKELLLIALNQESEQVITTEMNTILDLYEHVNELPLDEILSAIDLTTDKLILVQNMEKKGKKEWSIEKHPVLFHTLLALPIAYFLIKTFAL